MSNQELNIVCACGNGNVNFTSEGGIYETFVNNTGTSVKGTIVIASKTVTNGVDVAPISATNPIGVIYESGKDNGATVKVVVYGKAEVLLAADKTATKGYWCGTSNDTAGRMYQLQNPPSESSTHSQEIGHSLQSASAGTLSFVQLHFN